VTAIGDLDLRTLQALWQRPQHAGGDDVAALDRDEFTSGNRRNGDQPAALDDTAAPLRALGVMQLETSTGQSYLMAGDPGRHHGPPQPPTSAAPTAPGAADEVDAVRRGD
jgi:hypothetical protein